MELKARKIKKVEILQEKDSVYDINVQDVHHYILSSGLVTHNTQDMYPQEVQKGGTSAGYSASTICFMSKAKLKEGMEDDLDLGQSGIVVTAKMIKNRLAKPKKVKFEISFVSGCNQFVGLDYWCTDKNFTQIGVAKGKISEDGKFTGGGNRWYVKHLGKHVASADLFSEFVFTKDVLIAMEPIINDYFRFKNITEIAEINKRLEDAKGNISEKELYGADEASQGTSNFFEEED